MKSVLQMIPLLLLIVLPIGALAGGETGNGTCTPGGNSPGCKPNLDPPMKPDLPVPKEHKTPDKPDPRIHSEGHGCGSLKTGGPVEPTGCFKDKTISIGITVHYLTLPKTVGPTYIELPSLE